MAFRNTLYALALLLAAVPGISHAYDDITGIPSVIDGDTLDIHGTRIRLHGVDAPESSQRCLMHGESYRCGQKAALALDEFIGDASITCKGDKTDRYKRKIAVCYLKGTDINAWLVENGWALAYRQYSSDYVHQEQEAQAQKRGIWKGEFQAPWDFRKTKRR